MHTASTVRSHSIDWGTMQQAVFTQAHDTEPVPTQALLQGRLRQLTCMVKQISIIEQALEN